METTDKPVVLVMDDNEDQRDMLAITFQIMGYRVMRASSVGGAMMILHDEENEDKRFVVIVDMRMRSGTDTTSSLEFLSHVRLALRHRVFPIVYTGDSNPDLEDQAIKAGSVIFLHKIKDEERLKIYVKNCDPYFEILRDSTTDGVTDLHHRKSFQRQVRGVLDLARTRKENPTPPECMSLVLIDLDYFKRINDKHGWSSGDVALQVIADHIRSSIRHQVDIASRYGGDEFAVFLPGATSIIASGWGMNLSDLIASTSMRDRKDREVPVSISFGFGTLTLDEIKSGADLKELLHAAEWDEDTGLKPRRARARGLVSS